MGAFRGLAILKFSTSPRMLGMLEFINISSSRTVSIVIESLVVKDG